MDDFFNPPQTESSDADDFLRREREALGDSFSAPVGGANGGSHEHDFETSAAAFPDLDDDDGLGSFVSSTPAAVASAGVPPPSSYGGGSFGTQEAQQVSVTGTNEFAAFENEYPELEETSAPIVQNNGYGASPYQQPPSMFQSTPAPAPVEQESEFIRSWKVKQAEEIERREAESSRKKEETIVKAQNAIDNFYKEYNSKKEKNISKNKEEEEAFNEKRTDALAKGTTWERICTMVELQDSRSKSTTKSKQDVARFKEILLALKREGESAPGAAGF
ncbi:hypothetical protein P7C70_g5299, partial [Phenoliferia sp. Uapishka_3]